jgi:hypothetical protein
VDHSKSSQKSPVFEMVKNKMAANHSKSGHDVRFSNGPRLDHFVTNKIFFMTLFFIKRYRLVDHSKSGHDVWFSNGPKLELFVMNKIFFYDSYLYKTV